MQSPERRTAALVILAPAAAAAPFAQSRPTAAASGRVIDGVTNHEQGLRPATLAVVELHVRLITSVRRRMSKGLLFTASYTLAKAKSTIGGAVDQLNVANIQDPNNPFDAPVQNGPTADTDARHRASLSGTVALPWEIQVTPVYLYRSALPVSLIDDRDLNLDGDATEIPTRAYAVATFNKATGVTTFKDIGACLTINCGRGMSQHQMNIRVSKAFRVHGRVQVNALVEVFNLFNNVNPSGFRARVTVPSTGLADPALLQPTTYSGDTRRPEQRVGQVGFRISF